MTRYQDDIEYFTEHNTEILAISVDAGPSQKKFAEELGAQYRFLADWPDREVSRLYGVLSEKGFANRTSFLIDKRGIIRRIDSGQDAMNLAGIKAACADLG